ncbi:molybdate ABC transporter substrate-binding protein [Rhodobacter capsulatus]|uniref:molybdate ABC transporter substrate-binding protein n=1 Tax=Rhodobacter capsulatus TaxID=1061 RepID=UPI004028BB54
MNPSPISCLHALSREGSSANAQAETRDFNGENHRLPKVGIPDKKSAIYGKAGRQFPNHAGLAAKVDPKLITVATVPQVTAYLTSGDVDAGFLNIADAIGAKDDLGGWRA